VHLELVGLRIEMAESSSKLVAPEWFLALAESTSKLEASGPVLGRGHK